jgi:hypothetical protein
MPSHVLTPPVMQETTRRARIKQREGDMLHTSILIVCSSGRRAGWAVSRFDSLVLSEVPGVVSCSCAQGKGTFLHIARYEAPYEALPAPRIGAQPFLANRSFTTWGSGDHRRQYKAWLWLRKFVRSSVFRVFPERAKRECVMSWPRQRRSRLQ